VSGISDTQSLITFAHPPTQSLSKALIFTGLTPSLASDAKPGRYPRQPICGYSETLRTLPRSPLDWLVVVCRTQTPGGGLNGTSPRPLHQ
jgi:hypothetical protein